MLKGIQKTLYVILIFFVSLFIASSFFIRAEYNYVVYGDTPMLQQQHVGTFILLIIALLVFSVMLYRLCLKLNVYRPKIVIPLVLLGSLAIQVAIIFLFPRLPTDDSQTVVSLAMNMLYKGDYSTFGTTGYLHMFPFNYSTVLYIEALLAMFPDNYVTIKLANIGFALITTLMIYLIYKQLNPNSKDNDYGVLVFAATYIPSLFMSNFIYNDVIATTLLTSALYFGIRFMKEKSIKYILFAATLVTLGNYFRSIGIIFLLAIVISLFFHFKQLGWKKVVLSVCLFAVLFNIPSWTQNTLLQTTDKVQTSTTTNAAPIYMWLNMGINLKTIGFWDNRESYNIYQRDADYNKAVSTELFKESIAQKLSTASFGDLVHMYYKKIIWTWTEGTYQIERYGIGNDGSSGGQRASFIMGGYSYPTAATELFAGNSLYRSGILWVLYTMNFLMYGFILIRLIGSLRAKRFDEVSLVLVILGFVGFYILWEIKSRYIYPVYPLLIILSYMGFKDTYEWLIQQDFLRLRSSARKES